MNEKRKTRNEKRGVRLLASAMVMLSFSFFIFHFSLAQQTQPATTQSAGSIQKWLDQLADTEPVVREEARSALLKLSRDDLAALKEAVRESIPLAAAQSGALHDIVTHVYLINERYLSDPATGFLGVRLAELDNNQLIAPQTVQFDDDGKTQAGVLIRQCMPGFAAFAVLREGDVVISVGEDGAILTPTQEALVAAVSMLTPGQLVTLRVLRQGRPIDVSLRLSARPRAADAQPTTEEMLNDRLNRAEEYWKANFAALVAGPVS